MSAKFSTWEHTKAEAAAVDPRIPAEREAGQGATAEHREAYVRGHQLAEVRKAVGLTQAQVAEMLGVSQARVSKIEHGEISGIDIVRAYVSASAAPSTSSPPSATVAGRSPDRTGRPLRSEQPATGVSRRATARRDDTPQRWATRSHASGQWPVASGQRQR